MTGGENGAYRPSENFIVKSVSGFYYVETADGVLECKARGLFRKQGTSPLVGDAVRLERGETNLITHILPRRNFLHRPPLANLDILFIVASMREPAPNLLLLDRLTALAVSHGITPVILATKADLAPDDSLRRHYEKSGIDLLSAAEGTENQLGVIRAMLPGKMAAFTGNSGVGKTTLINALAPGLSLATADISQKLGRGRHTTRQVELYHLAGGLLADTPGFSALELSRGEPLLKDQLQNAFPEFAPHIPDCYFTGCAHIKEKGCAVRAAVEAGEIGRGRYESYMALYQEAKEIREWEI